MKVGDGSAFGQGADHNHPWQPWPPTQRPVVCGGETLASKGGGGTKRQPAVVRVVMRVCVLAGEGCMHVCVCVRVCVCEGDPVLLPVAVRV